MAYEKAGTQTLDYDLCRYGASKLLFRGPKRRLEGRYAAFLGGTETFGKYIAKPFPVLTEERTGARCVNFGWPNAGIDVFLGDAEVRAAAGRAEVTVLQVPGAQNMSNRFYSVHPRRNDRYVQASPMLRAMFSDVDFTEFHFTRHLLGHLSQLAPERFALVREELQAAWSARMRLFLTRIDSPVMLLWMASHAPPVRADLPGLPCDPGFVTRAMLNGIAPHAAHLVEVPASAAARKAGSRGMVHSEFESAAAAELLGPTAHEEVARALAPRLACYIRA
jgi:hypothetical protein